MAISLECLKILEVSAASGLLLVGEHFYVVADDELSLLKFSLKLDEPSKFIPLLPGDLPAEQKARKKTKPDFEALVELSPNGPILALPSGSKPNRIRGALISGEDVTEISFEDLFAELSSAFRELNIEGAVSVGKELKLFQRGNGKSHQNGIIVLDLDQVMKDLENRASLSLATIKEIKTCDLGKSNDVPLSFTDAAVESPEKIWFVAAAERTEDTYSDGEYVGAILGCLNSKCEIIFKEELLCPSKPEGLCLDLRLGSRHFFVVTDSDDMGKRSELFRGQLPKKSFSSTPD